MTFRGKLTGWVLIGLLGGAVGQGCGANSGVKHTDGSGGTVGTAGRDTGTMTVEPSPQAGTDGESPYDVLCGIPDKGCVPDDAMSCSKVIVAGAGGSTQATGGMSSGGQGGRMSVPEGGAPQGGVGASAGESPAGGAGAAGAPGGEGGAGQGGAVEPSQAGVPGAAGEPVLPPPFGGAPGRSGSGGQSAGVSGQSPGVMLQPSASCQVSEDKTPRRGKPIAACGPAGTGQDASACFTNADCAAGLACVGDGPGLCRYYCCAGASACEDHGQTHCTPQPLLANPKTSKTLMVPVCMPPVNCPLSEPYPCVPAGTCSCPDESACLVVRDDGTTSCVPESLLPADGKGVEGKPCPCTFGYVCSQATDECVKLCQVVAPEVACASGRCQASPSLPEGWGTCVGTPAKDAGAP